MCNLTLGEWRAPCLSRVASQHSENSGTCEIILYDLLCAKSANEYMVNNHFQILNPPINVEDLKYEYPAVVTFSGGFTYTQALLHVVSALTSGLEYGIHV